MSIIKLPNNESLPAEIMCVLCSRRISPADATIGPTDASGEPSMICNGHLWDDLKFIDMLADYLAGERNKFVRINNHASKRFGA